MLVYLVALPRTSSTAFESSMLTRNDFEKIYHEPWCLWYYTNKGFSVPEKYHIQSFKENKTDKYSLFNELLKDSAKRNVFVKDFSYNLFEVLSQFSKTRKEIPLSNVKFVFLFRHPRTTTVSFHKTATYAHQEVLDFMEEQLNYEIFRDTYRLAWKLVGEKPLLIESEHLVNMPEEVIRCYCDYLNIEFRETMLMWSTKEQDLPLAWELGKRWHEDTIQSTGFKARASNENYYAALPTQEQDRIEKLIDQQLPFYEELKAYSATADLVASTSGKASKIIESDALSSKSLHSSSGFVAKIGKEGSDGGEKAILTKETEELLNVN